MDVPYSVTVSGSYAYIAGYGSDNMAIVDISNPTNPTLVANWDPNNTNVMETAYSVTVSGSYAYIAGGDSDNMAIVDIGSLDVANMEAGTIKTGTLAVTQTAQFDQDISVHSGANIGHNALISGSLAITGTASSTKQSNNITPSLWIQSGKMIIGTSSMAVATSTNIPHNSLLVTNGIVCVDNGGGNNCARVARTRGYVYAEGSSLTGLDLAEVYPTKDTTLSPGEIVMLDSENEVFVTRYSTTTSLREGSEADDEAIHNAQPHAPLGIITTDPGILLGGFKTSPEYIGEETVGIALTGRVPTLVTNENGDIKVGDKIAVSQYRDGYGTKATKTGYTVGVALESATFDGAVQSDSKQSIATTSIKVFVDPQYYFSDTEVYVDPNTGFVGIGTTSPQYKLHIAGEVGAQGFINVSTQDAKKDIEYLTQEDKVDALTDIRNLKIATYHYTTEEDSAPLRLGIIAEEAPENVLSIDKKGVDLYKLSALTLAGVQELSQKVTSLERALGISLSDLDPTAEGGEQNSLIAIVVNGLKGLGVEISQGYVGFKGLFTKDLTVGTEQAPSGIQLYDKKDGTPYCVRIHNDDFIETKGLCKDITQDTTQTVTPNPNPTPTPTEDTTGTEIPTEEVPVEETTQSDQTDTPTPSTETTTEVTEVPTEEVPVEEETEVAPVEETPVEVVGSEETENTNEITAQAQTVPTS
jgi:hypothetical protein